VSLEDVITGALIAGIPLLAVQYYSGRQQHREAKLAFYRSALPAVRPILGAWEGIYAYLRSLGLVAKDPELSELPEWLRNRPEQLPTRDEMIQSLRKHFYNAMQAHLDYDLSGYDLLLPDRITSAIRELDEHLRKVDDLFESQMTGKPSDAKILETTAKEAFNRLTLVANEFKKGAGL
jgi:hypothetical protein